MRTVIESKRMETGRDSAGQAEASAWGMGMITDRMDR
jgi:hypothetical protein